ncbi:hypothetical protein R3P38DRAFT_2784443 [Favolaschia claudopus]|uniref:Uncharacterized protein n=1 Tax=Favolaschia claudopus TaxID=2862362 RepID=A0AAW0AVQ7_9AGAR
MRFQVCRQGAQLALVANVGRSDSGSIGASDHGEDAKRIATARANSLFPSSSRRFCSACVSELAHSPKFSCPPSTCLKLHSSDGSAFADAATQVSEILSLRCCCGSKEVAINETELKGLRRRVPPCNLARVHESTMDGSLLGTRYQGIHSPHDTNKNKQGRGKLETKVPLLPTVVHANEWIRRSNVAVGNECRDMHMTQLAGTRRLEEPEERRTPDALLKHGAKEIALASIPDVVGYEEAVGLGPGSRRVLNPLFLFVVLNPFCQRLRAGVFAEIRIRSILVSTFNRPLTPLARRNPLSRVLRLGNGDGVIPGAELARVNVFLFPRSNGSLNTTLEALHAFILHSKVGLMAGIPLYAAPSSCRSRPQIPFVTRWKEVRKVGSDVMNQELELLCALVDGEVQTWWLYVRDELELSGGFVGRERHRSQSKILMRLYDGAENWSGVARWTIERIRRVPAVIIPLVSASLNTTSQVFASLYVLPMQSSTNQQRCT